MIHVFSVPDGKSLTTIELHTDSITVLTVHDDTLYSGSDAKDGSIRATLTEGFSPVGYFQGHADDRVVGIDVSPDGRFLVSSGQVEWSGRRVRVDTCLVCSLSSLACSRMDYFSCGPSRNSAAWPPSRWSPFTPRESYRPRVCSPSRAVPPLRTCCLVPRWGTRRV